MRAALAMLVLVAACDGAGDVADLDMQEADFGCILEWPQIRRFRITNKRGLLDEALRVAKAPGSGVFPVGTVVQLVPTEAMVKRAPGFNAATADWEFFSLGIRDDGSTSILSRGAAGTVNAFGGNCFACHAKAEAKWDFLCEEGHGCDPLPIGPGAIQGIQDGDTRCR